MKNNYRKSHLNQLEASMSSLGIGNYLIVLMIVTKNTLKSRNMWEEELVALEMFC